MLMSKDNQATFQTAIGNLPTTMRSSILNASVKFTGQGPKGGNLTGSGVIVYAENGTTTIATAKHLLYVLAGEVDQPAWSNSLVTDFQQRVSIHYDGPMQFNMEPGRTATISAVTPITPNAQNPWEYDVMIVTSTDASLAGFASIYGVNGVDYSPTDQDYLYNANRYLKRQGQVFIQTGYGSARETAEDKAKTLMPNLPQSEIGTNTSGCLQFRTTAPIAEATVTVFGQRKDITSQYDQSIHAVQLTADPTSSTGPGDSGGPLFVVTRLENTQRFFLIGVTTGYDQDTAPVPCPTPGQGLRVNNVSTSLEYCYRNTILPY